VNIVETRDWRAEIIIAYLRGHYEPQDELEEKILKQRATGYDVIDVELYKSGVTEPWLRCMTSEKRSRKQLKVVISTWASMPSGRKSTKFVKQILSTCTRHYKKTNLL
jgi:hypothetical protein